LTSAAVLVATLAIARRASVRRPDLLAFDSIEDAPVTDRNPNCDVHEYRAALRGELIDLAARRAMLIEALPRIALLTDVDCQRRSKSDPPSVGFADRKLTHPGIDPATHSTKPALRLSLSL
jgi:hypothetical protein